MKNVFILFTFLILSTSVFAQKDVIEFDKKTKIGTVNGEFLCKIEKKKASTYSMKILDKNGETQIKIVSKSYKSPMEVSKANPTGRVDYASYQFVKSGKKAEHKLFRWKAKKVVKFLVKTELFKDGLINPEGVEDFVSENGMEFSKKIQY